MPAGRPTKYDPAFCDKVIELAREGASKAEIALELDICYDTFSVWQKDIPEFSEAVKKAERLSQGWWEQKGRKATFGEVEGFNATSYIFNMKNRFKHDWRDKVEQDLSSSDGSMTPKPAIDMSKLSADTLREIASLEPDA